MPATEDSSRDDRFIGIDIGGTKVLASVVTRQGIVIGGERVQTPRGGGANTVLTALVDVITDVLRVTDTSSEQIAALGVAVPGVVNPTTGDVVVTPNMSLTGVSLGPFLEEKFSFPVAMGNDCNLGALGEKWLGVGREAQSLFAMLVGTGIGGGLFARGQIWRGAREVAAEVGHIVMEIGGPRCGCGNLGCFEAIASRTAIERELRAAIESGEKSLLTELSGGDLTLIRSGVLREALSQNDPLTHRIMRVACEIIGGACLTVRHLIDPEIICLGGGVIEACSDFMMPIIEEIFYADSLAGANDKSHVAVCSLGDDAVVLGAVALAQQKIGLDPFTPQARMIPTKEPVSMDDRTGNIRVGDKLLDGDVRILVGGKTGERKGSPESAGRLDTLSHKRLTKLVRGGPELVIFGAAQQEDDLNERSKTFLRRRRIEHKVLPTREAIDLFNHSKQRVAALLCRPEKADT